VMVECKFHNSLGLKSNIQCTLYTYARFPRPENEPGARLFLPCYQHPVHVRCRSVCRMRGDAPARMALSEGTGLEQLVEKHRCTLSQYWRCIALIWVRY